MNIVAISDLHGKSFREIYERKVDTHKDADKIILMGDYFDSYDYDLVFNKFQIKNFEEIIKIKKEDQRIEMLVGNHEAMYLWEYEEEKVHLRYYSKLYKYENEVKAVMEENIKHLKMAYQTDKYIYSHQGITNTFMDEAKCNSIDELNQMLYDKKYSMFDLKEGLRYRFNEKLQDESYDQLKFLINDRWKNTKQVVGHYVDFVISDDIIVIENNNHANVFEIKE